MLISLSDVIMSLVRGSGVSSVNILYRLAARFLYPELAHQVMVFGLKHQLIRYKNGIDDPRLSQNFWGLNFRHPVGLAAGFDKNGECISALLGWVFGFMEAGTVTLHQQYGNPRPRIFRLFEDGALINRLGFNNKGVDALLERLRIAKEYGYDGVLGVNIGMSKGSKNPQDDYVALLEKVWRLCDYVTVNISSPNTEGLRDLQYGRKMEDLLHAIAEARHSILQCGEKGVFPILLKISPDISGAVIPIIAELSLKYGVDGLVLTNTTISARGGLLSVNAKENGGLSGLPLFKLSNQVLSKFYQLTKGRLILIGCGGISSGDDAYTKIKLGASLMQLYTGLVYEGFGLVERINSHILQRMQQDGFKNIGEAVGSAVGMEGDI